MHLTHLSLTNFRSYARLELDLEARIHIFQGENAQGKTNLLEAIYYLATTRSPLAATDRDLISWAATDDVIPYAYLRGAYVRAGSAHVLDYALALEQQPDQSGPPLFRRRILLDGIPRRALDVVGALQVVLFLPDDLAIVGGSPGDRRRYLDISLCQIDPVYCRALARYNRILQQRNSLLRQIHDRQARPDELAYWDTQLVTLGSLVLDRRLWSVGELGAHVAEIHPALTGSHETLTIEYQDSMSARLPARPPDDPAGALSAIEQRYHLALESVRREEIARAVTLIGPHRDKVHFLVNGIDANRFGSRGQQRTIALSLKLAEVELMRGHTGEMPVLLLDDVMSELDRRRSRYLLQQVARAAQVLMTTTDLTNYSADMLQGVSLWQVAGGKVTSLPGVAG
ncbi:MAG: DNA replication/repair protein RecF [Anaerolineae bacterium]